MSAMVQTLCLNVLYGQGLNQNGWGVIPLTYHRLPASLIGYIATHFLLTKIYNSHTEHVSFS